MLKGTKNLRIASIIELVIGLGSIAALLFLTDAADIHISWAQALENEEIWAICLVYGTHILEVLAGLFGLLLANNKSLFTCILGLIVFIINLADFINFSGNNMINITVSVMTMIVAYYYLHNAYRNFKG